MTTHKTVVLAAALILLFAVSAAAQKIARPIPIDTTVTVKVDAFEVSDGILGFDPNFGESMFGYAFVGEGTGDLTGAAMFSMNCFPAQFVANQSNQITGGSWALPLYMRPVKSFDVVYVGSLYGQAMGGFMLWDKTGTTAEVTMKLTLDGGTGTYAGVSGYAMFQGTLMEGEKETTLSGALTITYTPAP